MYKIFLSFHLFVIALYADTDAALYDMQNNLSALSKEIKFQEKDYNKINKEIVYLTKSIKKNKKNITSIKKDIAFLEKETTQIESDILSTENKIINAIITTYSTSIGIALAKRSTQNEIIDKEAYTILANNSKENVLKMMQQKKSLEKNKLQNKKKQKEYESYLKTQANQKRKFNEKKVLRKDIITKISQYRDNYKNKFNEIFKKEEIKDNLLVKLNIIDKQKMHLSNSFKYSENKTIPPIQEYTIVKKFGRYFDEIYKKDFYSNSIELQSISEISKVFNIFNGKVFFIEKHKENETYTVIIKNKNEMYTVYSNITNISEAIQVGTRIKKGTILGTINNLLIFQVTQKGNYLNPLKLFQ